ncbi:Linoleate diol synthase [Daldinia childiae]|uniref:Linoleate diol synthase n=1 Tax=Daldinia childiae TaxID=326645 RepID=UPI0014480D7D|nr:Linoleate diol synthase [Daldinia childiae]KAF3061010.1 Linoleate diol synthase [Daldinia childiae]
MSSPFAQAIQVITRALGPLPKYQFTPGNDDTPKETGLLQDLQHLGVEDYKTLKDVLDATVSGEEDDNELLQERIVTLLAKLPPNSREGKQATDAFVNTLWNSLEHPPAQILARDACYRTANGSYNNLEAPAMGAANTRYTRTTPAKVFQGPNLPDPGLIYDSIMARDRASFREHPNKISSVLFYLATIITHDIFQTMFNRFHNYVVTQLAGINENGRFTKPVATSEGGNWEVWEKYDNDLFQTGRLITCGLYVNIILKDYVRTILNVNRSGTTWGLDPRTQEKKNIFNSSPAPEATGNQVSVEFNLIYRWHSALSTRDEKWVTDDFRKILDGADPAKASVDEMSEISLV